MAFPVMTVSCPLTMAAIPADPAQKNLGGSLPRTLRLSTAQLQSLPVHGDNLLMDPHDSRDAPIAGIENPFRPGAIVLLTLGNPREKFWGAILALTAQGLSLAGIELGSFEDLVSMIKAGDPASRGVVFFPMHRVERVELDAPDGGIPSLSQRFTAKTGLDPASLLTANLMTGSRAGGDLK